MELALPDDAGRTAASRPLRFAARACDLSLIAYLFGVLVIEIRGRLLGGDVFATRPLAGAQNPQEILAVLVAVVLLTDTLPMAIWGRSLGKAMLGLRAVRTDDPARSPGVLRAVFRTVLTFGVLVVPPVVGIPMLVALVVSTAVDPTGRGLHDRLAGTLVVSVPRPDPPASRALPLASPRPPHPDDL
ncbi:MAG TPA: RDD family protein [Acidimicrobiales bacterium]|nr:RDD family protein [Acidimicrobiales bacterium]